MTGAVKVVMARLIFEVIAVPNNLSRVIVVMAGVMPRMSGNSASYVLTVTVSAVLAMNLSAITIAIAATVTAKSTVSITAVVVESATVLTSAKLTSAKLPAMDSMLASAKVVAMGSGAMYGKATTGDVDATAVGAVK